MSVPILNSFISQRLICYVIPYTKNENVEFHIGIKYHDFNAFVNRVKHRVSSVGLLTNTKTGFSIEPIVISKSKISQSQITTSLVLIYSTDKTHTISNVLFKNELLSLNSITSLNDISDFFIIQSIMSLNNNKFTDGLFRHYYEMINSDLKLKSELKSEILKISVIQCYINKLKPTGFNIEAIIKHNNKYDNIVRLLKPKRT